MAVKIFSAANIGYETFTVEVEAEIVNGLPSLEIVGLGDKAVQEAKQRIYTAIKNSGAEFPKRRKIINLAPAHIRKVGPSFDLPMAIALLSASGQFSVENSENNMFFGELALDGSVRGVRGILPLAMHAKKEGFQKIFVPEQNAREAALIADIEIYPVSHLIEFIQNFSEIKRMPPYRPEKSDKIFKIRFQDIKGQEHAKRALVIAASGGHHVLLRGPPGGGKTMLGLALQSILPPMNFEEALEVTNIHSLVGIIDDKQPLVAYRPFRKIHSSATLTSLIGGGNIPKPGEISLAHRGVLFLDEMTEFPGNILDALRIPLEEGTIHVQRAQGKSLFPARFQLIGAMNPCPCGYMNDPKKTCACSPKEIYRYQKKLSGPLLDRMDIFLDVPRLTLQKLTQENVYDESAMAASLVARARDIQESRFQGERVFVNSEMDHRHIKQFCGFPKNAEILLKKAIEAFSLSPRGYFRLLKVARTIADIEMKENIEEHHVSEALQYRFPNV